MQNVRYQGHATRAQLSELVDSLRQVDGVEVSAEVVEPEASFARPRPLRHMSGLDFVITVVVSVGSGVVANVLTSKLEEWRRKSPNGSIDKVPSSTHGKDEPEQQA